MAAGGEVSWVPHMILSGPALMRLVPTTQGWGLCRAPLIGTKSWQETFFSLSFSGRQLGRHCSQSRYLGNQLIFDFETELRPNNEMASAIQ